MRQLLILADDLSGAADCANSCVSAGLKSVVTFDENDHHPDCDVLAVDCNSRHLEPEKAAARMIEVMRAYDGASGDLIVIKKVDSSLRGNVGAELAATLVERRRTSGSQRVVAVMAPAFPFNGRTTVDGYQLLHGKSLHQTEIWLHDGLPGEAHVPSLLARAGLVTSTLNLGVVRAGIDGLCAEMHKAALTADALVCDAETDEDLRAIAIASLSLGRQTVWAGTAGLTYQLPKVAGLLSKTLHVELPELFEGPSLFVIGSMSSVSCEQTAQLARLGTVNTINIPPRTLLDGPQSPNWIGFASSIEVSLRTGRDTLVKLEAGERIDPKERRLLTDALGVMLTPHRHTVGALVASGGETARAILTGWGVESLQLISEVEPGLPFSIANCAGVSLPVLTKAGAFGKPETLLNCLGFLKNLERSDSVARHGAQRL